jgi:hypothetical protein
MFFQVFKDDILFITEKDPVGEKNAHYIMYPSNTIKGLIDRTRPGIMLHQTR